jgi:hypothetical protein
MLPNDILGFSMDKASDASKRRASHRKTRNTHGLVGLEGLQSKQAALPPKAFYMALWPIGDPESASLD